MRNFVKLFLSVAVILVSEVAVAAEDSDFTVVPGIDIAFKQSSLNAVVKGVPDNNALRPSYITIILKTAITPNPPKAKADFEEAQAS